MKTLIPKQQGQHSELRVRKLRNAVLVAAFMAVLTSLASADIYSDLTVNLVYNQCINPGGCDLNPGYAGSPALGRADFTSLSGNPPWSYNFQTGFAYYWSNVPYGNTTYTALFNSGTFNMNGPYGLTFTGTITSGVAYLYGMDNGEEVDVNFSGYWSDGIYATGTADINSFFGKGPFNVSEATLNTAAQAPEPSSLALFGSGVLGLGGLLRRRFLG